MVGANPVCESEFWVEDPNPTRRERLRHRRPSRRKVQLAHAGRLLAGLALAAILVFVLGARYAAMSSMGYRIVALKAELAALQGQHDHLQAEASRLNAPGRVEESAQLVLGMTRPDEIRTMQVLGLQVTGPSTAGGRTVSVVLDGGAEPVPGAQVASSLLDRTADWFYGWLVGTRVEARSIR